MEDKYKDILDNKKSCDYLNTNGEVEKCFENVPDNVTVSLSGGVDSMVCLEICKKLNKNITAVHINYNNRETSYQESFFVKEWCSSLGITLHVRNITEMTRNSIDREVYEEFTRVARFNEYRKVNLPVVLGHNRDDAFENIITNINKHKIIDNIVGMKLIDTIDGVEIMRPMLNIPKSMIIAYARANNIPFLYDSTPKWSQRGKIRDNIIPAMKTFDVQLELNMLNFAKDVSEIIKHIPVKDSYPREEIINNETFWNHIIGGCKRGIIKEIMAKFEKGTNGTIPINTKRIVSFYETEISFLYV